MVKINEYWEQIEWLLSIRGPDGQRLYLTPLRPLTKIPAVVDGGFNVCSCDIEQLREWHKKYTTDGVQPNWGINLRKSGLFALDTDFRHGGHLVLKEILDQWKFQLPPTLSQRTYSSGSEIGHRLYWKPDCEIRGDIESETITYADETNNNVPCKLEIKYAAQIVVAPSIVAFDNGGRPTPAGRYCFVDCNVEIASVEGAFLDWIKRGEYKPVIRKEDTDYDRAFRLFRIRQCVDVLRNVKMDRLTWVKYGMAIHHGSGVSQEGHDEWIRLTSGINFKDGDEEKAQGIWDSFGKKRSDREITVGTLIQSAEAAGMPKLKDEDGNALRYGFIRDEFKDGTKKPSYFGEDTLFPDWRKTSRWEATGYTLVQDKEIDKLISPEHHAIQLLNYGSKKAHRSPYCWVKNSVCCVEDEKISPPVSSTDFTGTLGPYGYWIKIVKTDAKGNSTADPKFISAAKAWKESSFRRQYAGEIFSHIRREGYYNSYSEQLAYKPIRSDHHRDLVLRLLVDYVCDGKVMNRDVALKLANYILQHFAFKIKNMTEKSPVILWPWGVQGTGKGVFFQQIMGNSSRSGKPGIFGERCGYAATNRAIGKTFNDRMAKKHYRILDEIIVGKDTAQNLKADTGGMTEVSEKKWKDEQECHSYAITVCTSQYAPSAMWERSNRRLISWECSTQLNGDEGEKLVAEIDEAHEKCCQAFLYHLMEEVDLSGYHPMIYPKELDRLLNGVELKRVSMNGITDFFYQLGNQEEGDASGISTEAWDKSDNRPSTSDIVDLAKAFFKNMRKEQDISDRTLTSKWAWKYTNAEFGKEMKRILNMKPEDYWRTTKRVEGKKHPLEFKGICLSIAEIKKRVNSAVNVVGEDDGVDWNDVPINNDWDAWAENIEF